MAAPVHPRLFVGVSPSPAAIAAIDRWRAVTLAGHGKPLASRNLHLTLAFFGATDVALATTLMTAIDQIAATSPPTQAVVDRCEYWPKPAIAVLAASHVEPELATLAERLRSLSGDLALHRESLPYRPHLTLSRNLSALPQLLLAPPTLTLAVDQITLFESRREQGQLRYLPLAHWPLRDG